MQNLHQIGFHPNTQIVDYFKAPNPHYISIVLHAIQRFCHPDIYNEVINGFRRSTWSEERLLYGFEKMNTPEHNVIKDEHYYKALDAMNELFRPTRTLYPVHYADLRLYPWRLSTNIGAPYNLSPYWISLVKSKLKLGITTDARMTKHNLYNEFFVNNRFLMHLLKEGHTTDTFGNDLKYWNTSFARLHLVDFNDPDKVRLVFGAPTLFLQAEMPFIWPISVSLLNRGESSPMLWGYETIIGGWYRLRNWFATTHPRLNTFFTFDWSGFDRDARHTVIHDIHDIWSTWFDFDLYWPTRLYPHAIPDNNHMRNLWKWMTHTVTHLPLLLPDGRLIQFLHSGIFSGYLQTQLLDSCYNTVQILTILSRMGFDIKKVALKVQGDDSIGGFLEVIPPPLFPSFLAQFKYLATQYFGSTLNDKKSELSSTLENLEVLKYRNHGGIPYRSEPELLAMLLYPERSQRLDALMARSIGIAYANCGRHTSVFNVCENIHSFLDSIGIKPSKLGLPDAHRLMFYGAYEPTFYSIGHFPTYFETISHLLDKARPLVDTRHWDSSHFIGTPV
jgi:hypothetical protein